MSGQLNSGASILLTYFQQFAFENIENHSVIESHAHTSLEIYLYSLYNVTVDLTLKSTWVFQSVCNET